MKRTIVFFKQSYGYHCISVVKQITLTTLAMNKNRHIIGELQEFL